MRRIVFAILITLITSSCSRQKRIIAIIAGDSGNYWDIIYNESHYRKEPSQGYFIRPDGKFYSYYYRDSTRVPFNDGLFDAIQAETIEGNLRQWSLEGDSILNLDESDYTINSINLDTISLTFHSRYKPEIKLMRSVK